MRELVWAKGQLEDSSGVKELFILNTLLSVLVIACTKGGVAEHLVCLTDFKELLLSLRVILILVRVQSPCLVKVRLFNLPWSRIGSHAQHIIILRVFNTSNLRRFLGCGGWCSPLWSCITTRISTLPSLFEEMCVQCIPCLLLVCASKYQCSLFGYGCVFYFRLLLLFPPLTNSLWGVVDALAHVVNRRSHTHHRQEDEATQAQPNPFYKSLDSTLRSTDSRSHKKPCNPSQNTPSNGFRSRCQAGTDMFRSLFLFMLLLQNPIRVLVCLFILERAFPGIRTPILPSGRSFWTFGFGFGAFGLRRRHGVRPADFLPCVKLLKHCRGKEKKNQIPFVRGERTFCVVCVC
eukprot:comp22960_c0_seq1/m.36453 comp22960_c0_seq1/g.36453  ORF comp22960_c0_seq1/g.36453 comp22960_c0_seq1/m.36453 type:complete len:348 (+) comp22960_c0_seq1:971-2014(+)